MERVIRAIWSTYGIRSQTDSSKLHLMHSYFHEPTALHNEGVWHNCLMGMNYLKLGQLTHNETYTIVGRRMAQSLLALNFDREKYLFRARTVSGHWDTESTKWPHMTNYDQGYKLTHQIIALIFYSFLYNQSSENGRSSVVHMMDDQQSLDLLRLQDAIHTNFLNAERNLYRRELLQDDNSNEKTEYFRAMDHALLYIAQQRMKCVGMPMNQSLANTDFASILLDTFRYNDLKHSITYIRTCDKEKESRNDIPEGHLPHHFSWQDAWIIMALTMSKRAPLTALVNDFFTYYQWPGTDEYPFHVICNEPQAHGKTSWGSRLQRFTGDNVIAQMMLHWCCESQDVPVLLGEKATRFEGDLQSWLQTHAFNEGQVISDANILASQDKSEADEQLKPLFVKESDFEWPNSLWPMSEFLFSELFACRHELLEFKPKKD